MAKQKKVLDVNPDPNSAHLIVIQDNQAKYNPFRIYLVISPKGSPLRKRILNMYGDFMSCIYFIKDFYLEGIDTMCYTDMVKWVRKSFGDA